MRKSVRPLLALSLASILGLCAQAQSANYAGYANDSYGSQISYDSFNWSVKKRLESVRIGSISQPFGRRTVAPDSYSGGSGYTPPGYNQGGFNNQGGYYQAPGYNNGMNGGYNSGYNQGGGYDPNAGFNSYNGGAGGSYNYNQGNQFGALNTFSSDEAYAMAPSSRVSSSSSYRRRQLDCVYYSGFTVWADLYQTWAKQRSRGNDDGYRYRTFGPAIGVDWTDGPITVGAAMTYNWGKLKSRNYNHDRNLRTFGLELYGQYNADLFYINGTLGYAHNTFRSGRSGWQTVAGTNTPYSRSDKYSSNAINLDAEFGWKFNFSGLNVLPNVGLRYFHDRRGSINEGGGLGAIRASSRNYHVFEMPFAVDVTYEINSGGVTIVPRGHLAWVPELSRKRGAYHGSYVYDNAGNTYRASEDASRRSRHGFEFGLGIEARLTKALSMHIDYNANFRSKAYEHHWNFGAGFTF